MFDLHQVKRERWGRNGGLSLTFLGTRGEIDARTSLHQRHSALLVRRGRTRIMIDCGADWLDRVRQVRPTAIVLTHAHPDHAHGLAKGAPCPLYATRTTWKSLLHYPIRKRLNMPLRKPVLLGGIRFEAFPVQHSLRAPAVGYRISAGGVTFFYAPDLVAIRGRRAALKGITLYIGDGAVIRRSLIRRRKGIPIGHISIQRQLSWCRSEGVPAAIFTHCGSEIVKGNPRRLDRIIRAMGTACGVDAKIAFDGSRVRLRRRRASKAPANRRKRRTRR